MVVNKDLFVLLLDVAIRGADILEERLGDLVTSWKTLLHLDTDGEWIETMKSLHPPPQARDRGAPPGLVYPEVEQDHTLVVNNVVLKPNRKQEERNELRLRSREEVNYVLNQKHAAHTVQRYVDSVKVRALNQNYRPGCPSCPRLSPSTARSTTATAIATTGESSYYPTPRDAHSPRWGEK